VSVRLRRVSLVTARYEPCDGMRGCQLPGSAVEAGIFIGDTEAHEIPTALWDRGIRRILVR
jgi:hypothetical protein